MGSGHRQAFASILRIAPPCTILVLAAAAAAADPASDAAVTAQDHFIEAALLPQTEDSLAVEEFPLLTPLDEITADTDFRQYMQDGVPADVRREALRKAWMLNPQIRDYKDPARDYAFDD